MQWVRSVCPRDCYDTCFVEAGVEEGAVRAVRGDPENPVTGRYLCPRGAADPLRMYRARVLHPYVRVGGKPGGRLVRVGWEEALGHAAERLREVVERHGAASVLHLEYSGNMGLLTQYYPLRLWNALGATGTDYAVCSASGHAALRLHYGSSHGLMPEELPGMRLLVFWGFNAAVSAPHIWRMALEARRRGALIAVVDPRRSETARLADIWAAPRPGTDAVLAYGVARLLAEKGMVDMGFVARHTHGYERFMERASAWSPGRVEEATGVRSGVLEELAEAYGSRRPSATLIGFGLQKSLWGFEAVRTVSLIPALLGMHRGFYYSNGDAWLVDLDLLTGRKLAKRKAAVVSQVSLARLVAEGRFKYIYIYGTNPAATLPGQGLLRRGLARSDVFVVVHETHWTETTSYADVVLPAPTYLEKDDVVVSYSHGYVRVSRRAVEPLGESRSEAWVMHRLAGLLGVGEAWVYQDPWEALEEALRGALEGGSFEDLLEGATLRLRRRPLWEHRTPTGRIEFYSIRAEEEGVDPLPIPAVPRIMEGRFVLLNSATPMHSHTQFREVYGPIPRVVHVNPRDASRLGIRSGDRVAVYNELGEVELQAVVTDAVPPGVLWVPRQLTGLNGTPLNTLVSPEKHPVGGGSLFNSTLVEIRRVPSVDQGRAS